MIRSAKTKDIEKLKSLWRLCFTTDDEEDISLFFDHRFSSAKGLVYEVAGEIISMMFRLPCKFNGKKAEYLYALATHPHYRKNGYMKDLITFAQADMQKRGVEYSLLLESEPSLRGYYGRFGYKGVFCCNMSVIAGQGDLSVLTASAEYVQKVRKKFLKNSVEWDLSALNYANKLSEQADEHWFKVDDGYAVASKKDDKAYISELICTDAISAAQSVNTYFGVREAIVRTPPQIHIGDKVYRGMIYSTQNEEINDAYISMTLE